MTRGGVRSVNLAVPHPSRAKKFGVTGIDKRPVSRPVFVCPPGPRGTGRGSGLAGDHVFDTDYHGGDDRAVYAFSREQLDFWEGELGRWLPDGVFGENITTEGIDLSVVEIGERWQIGDSLVLEVTGPRIPCGTFSQWMPERGWLRRFTEHADPGPYLRVVTDGYVGPGDEIRRIPAVPSTVSIAFAFRALLIDHSLIPQLEAIGNLTDDTTEFIDKHCRD